jgi:ubiquinone/menaquinone biosynthesis C-methylase UbiE
VTGAAPGAPRPAGSGGDKHERLGKAHDAEVWPVYAGRFAALALGALEVRPQARVVEVGAATGLLTVELARRFDEGTRITGFEETAAWLALARARVDADERARGRITLEAGTPAALPVADAMADVAISNLAAAEAPDPAAAAREMARVLVPGSQAILTVALRGSWAEFLDVYRDVLREQGRRESLATLERYVASLPDGDTAARWLEAAGFRDVEVALQRWEILFKTAREFFFSPLVELGPLSRWKQIAGRGDEMQDIFFFTKEAIDAYFEGTVFPVTVVGAVVKGRKA